MASFFPTQGPRSGDPNIEAVVKWIEDENRRLAFALNEFTTLRFQILNVAVEKPREGMVVWADGTNWNPGFGAGPYAYIGGAWTKLKP